MKEMMALYCYVAKGFSLGFCAEIAEMEKGDFIHYLSFQKVSIFHYDDEDDFLDELNNVRIENI